MELRSPSFFGLAALIDSPLHGYAIVHRAEELSRGTVRLSTGTLYALPERAIDEGRVSAGTPYVATGRQRRDYALTPAGRSELATEVERLSLMADTVGERLQATAGSGGDGTRPLWSTPGGAPEEPSGEAWNVVAGRSG
jgi:PadR family transcriptional regulator PadR